MPDATIYYLQEKVHITTGCKQVPKRHYLKCPYFVGGKKNTFNDVYLQDGKTTPSRLADQ